MTQLRYFVIKEKLKKGRDGKHTEVCHLIEACGETENCVGTFPIGMLKKTEAMAKEYNEFQIRR